MARFLFSNTYFGISNRIWCRIRRTFQRLYLFPGLFSVLVFTLHSLCSCEAQGRWELVASDATLGPSVEVETVAFLTNFRYERRYGAFGSVYSNFRPYRPKSIPAEIHTGRSLTWFSTEIKENLWLISKIPTFASQNTSSKIKKYMKLLIKYQMAGMAGGRYVF